MSRNWPNSQLSSNGCGLKEWIGLSGPLEDFLPCGSAMLQVPNCPRSIALSSKSLVVIPYWACGELTKPGPFPGRKGKCNVASVSGSEASVAACRGLSGKQWYETDLWFVIVHPRLSEVMVFSDGELGKALVL